MHYEKLFEKGTIGRLELRNRVVMTAMGTMLGDWNGCSTPEQVRFYEERAKGGCGLIIPEFTSVDPDSGHCNRIQLGIWDERQIASFERICDAVHRHGAKIFVQLHHGGREAPPAINGGRQAMAPSVELNSVVGRATILPREMTVEDIDRLVGLFVQAALNAQAAGADGVEIHGAHGYLLQQFLSPYTNKRTDEYGGSMENRCRFIVRILKGIREVVEPGFVVGARINGNDFVEGGNDQDACVEIAKYLEPYVDYFNVSCGVYASAATMIEPCYSPEGWRSGFVKAIKESGLKVKIDQKNAQNDQSTCKSIADKFVGDGVDLIYAIATPAAQAAAGATADIPIVGCAITDYAASGLVQDNDKPGTNVTGASDLTPVAEQLEMMQKVLPDVKKVGLLYCTAESNSDVQIKAAKKELDKLGLEYTDFTVSSSNEIQSVVESAVGKVDALYSPTDNTIAAGASQVGQICKENKLPFVTGEEGMCMAGGLFTLSINYEDLGYAAGEMAVKILKGEAKPEDMAIKHLSSKDLVVVKNDEMAEALGIDLSALDE